MQYPLNELNNQEFEDLVVAICHEILGIGTVKFSTGKDGGRDAKFDGKAKRFPSEAGPWNGKIVIQAKHTEKLNASCSDSDFQSILKKEVKEKLISLKEANLVDYYILFTNRKLSGIQDAKIESFIDETTGVSNFILGNEIIQFHLKQNPCVVRNQNLNRLLLPLQFYEQDLKTIIEAFYRNKPQKREIDKIFQNKKYVKMDRKNSLNNLGKEYFDSVIKSHYTHFDSIENFLSDPINRQFKVYYENTIDDLNAKITIKREEYSRFEELLDYLYEFVMMNNPDLKDKRKLVRVFLHYMYCECDIGRKE